MSPGGSVVAVAVVVVGGGVGGGGEPACLLADGWRRGALLVEIEGEQEVGDN